MEILTFRLAEEPFGISIGCVEAIEHFAPVTYVPKAKEHIAGLINIRGKIVPAIDMSKLLKLSKELVWSKLILIRHNEQPFALMVDDVDDVININEESITIVSTSSEDLSIINYQDMVITYIAGSQLNLI